jgi:hypothetical protein
VRPEIIMPNVTIAKVYFRTVLVIRVGEGDGGGAGRRASGGDRSGLGEGVRDVAGVIVT